jgi:hypothetical protein
MDIHSPGEAVSTDQRLCAVAVQNVIIKVAP